MINYNEERNTVIVYSSSVCNLNCRYCTIDKNPVLGLIDEKLEESFQGDYYFNRIKEYFPNKHQLHSLETWGGEPFLHMERIYPLLHQLIQHYPYFNLVHSSTNFSFEGWINKFMGIMDVFSKYSYRKFTYKLQLSVDGPTEINDGNRGQGVTKRCIENFDKLVKIIEQNKIPSNVTLIIYTKGTLDIEAIHHLTTKQSLIEYYQFLEENYLSKINSLESSQVQMFPAVPNMAVPCPATVEDGHIFALLVKLCREIEQENYSQHYFKYYQAITPFCSYYSCMNCKSFKNDMVCCGSGKQMIGFLPENLISVCHEGFTMFLEDYKKYAEKRLEENYTVNLNKFLERSPSALCLTDNEYADYEQKMKYLNNNSTVQYSIATTLIISLAMAGLIEAQYLNEEKALYAAKYIIINTAYCVKANYATTGSFALESPGMYILLLNGALKYLDNGEFTNGRNTKN